MTKNADISRIAGQDTTFGTQGSQVQILPLRPEIIRFFVLILILGQVGHRNVTAFLADSCCRALRLKCLSQILKQRARQLEIRGFESFGEAVVHQSQRMAGLIALAVFGEQAGQGHR